MKFNISLLLSTLIFVACKKDDYALKSNFLDKKKLISKQSQYFNFYQTDKESRIVITPKNDDRNTIFISAPMDKFIYAYKKNIISQAGYGSVQVIENKKELLCDRGSLDSIEDGKNGISLRIKLSGESCPKGAAALVKFDVVSVSRIRFTVETAPDNRLDALIMNYATNKGESFYGLGEQFAYLDFKGKSLPILVAEQGQGRHRPDLDVWPLQVRGDWFTTYAPVPNYLTKNYHGLFLYNDEYNEFSFKNDTSPSIKVWANKMSGEINWSTSYKGLIDEYTKATGRPYPLPDWVHKGAVMGTMGGTELVRALHKKLKSSGAELSSYWLQDWVGTRVVSNRKRLVWVWLGDDVLYPGWSSLKADVERDGLKMMGYFNSFLVDPAKLATPVTAREKALHQRRVKYFKEAVDGGYLIKRSNGRLYEFDSGDFKAYLVDFTNPSARAWLKKKMKEEITKHGFKGWMADFGEALPFDAVLSSGISGEKYHNHYPVEWAKINREVANELRLSDEAVIFHRSAYRGSQKYANLFWAGDQTTTWDEYDGFKSSIIGVLNGGLSGMAINHSDIGGYTNFLSPTMRSDELQARWIEANAFSPILRTHEGLTPEDNAQIYSSKFNLEFFAYFSKVYATLFEYRKAVFAEASRNGMPAMRHLMLEFPNEAASYEMDRYQYLLGADLLVAPVVEPKKTSRKVYLPGENVTWVHFWTGKKYASGIEVEVQAPLGQIPVFYKESNSVLQLASKESRTLIKNFVGANTEYPICLPGYSFKKIGNEKDGFKRIDCRY